MGIHRTKSGGSDPKGGTMKRGSFVDALYRALSQKKSVEFKFFGPDRSGVVIVRIRKGQIIRVDSTWGGGQKELGKIFIWRGGEYTEKEIDSNIPKETIDSPADTLSAEDVAGMERDQDLYAILEQSPPPEEAVPHETSTLERGLEIVEQIRSPLQLIEANRYELFDAMVSHLNPPLGWKRSHDRWNLAKEIFREVYRNQATGLVQGISSKGKIWALFLGGTTMGTVFWKTTVGEIREGKAALQYVHLLSTVEPMEWRFFPMEDTYITTLEVFFSGISLISGWMPAGSFLWWLKHLDQKTILGDLFYAVLGKHLHEGIVIFRENPIRGIRNGKTYTLKELQRILDQRDSLQVWGFSSTSI